MAQTVAFILTKKVLPHASRTIATTHSREKKTHKHTTPPTATNSHRTVATTTNNHKVDTTTKHPAHNPNTHNTTNNPKIGETATVKDVDITVDRELGLRNPRLLGRGYQGKHFPKC